MTGFVATGFAPCTQPARYLQQLVKHWGHKMAASWDGEGQVAAFPFAEHDNAVMTAQSDGIAITLVTGDADRNEQLRGVIERHLDRFAFREAPLQYTWESKP
ncbi:DUF2218 domain-containing protein [Croceibacterium sp. TMG7-5b_MA50]|uniref:DUF2218 domain-containing protein n=1 Tax=Croceibacterium sp. TMG7-5b_MA50 TaxID=3121290 RepID=UPI003221EF29